MADDNVVSIRITGAVDSSLTASTTSAQSAIAGIGASADRTLSPLQNLGESLEGIGQGLNGLSTGFKALDGAARGGGESLNGMGSAAKGLQPALSSLGDEAPASAIGGFSDVALEAAEALVRLGTRIFENTAALDSQSARAHMSAEDFQVYALALRESGMDADGAATTLGRFAVTLSDAQAKSGPARDALDELGMTAADIVSGDALPKVARGLLAMRDANERAQIEMELFSRAGPELEAALSTIAEGTDKLKSKYEGLFSTSDVADRARQASIDIDLSMQRLETSAAPAVTTLANALAGLMDDMNWLSAHHIPVTVFDEINEARQLFGNDDKKHDTADFFALSDLKPPPNQQPNTGGIQPVTVSGDVNSRDQGFGGSSPDQDKFENNLALQHSLAGLSPEQRAKELAVIQDANAALEDGNKIITDQNGNIIKTVSSYQQAVQVIGKQKAAQIEALAGAKEGDKTAAADAKATLEKQVDAVKDSGAQIIKADQGTAQARKDAVTKLWETFIKGERLTAAQVAGIRNEEKAQLARINEQAVDNDRAIARSDTDTQIEFAKIEQGEKKALLDQEVATGQITNARKIQLLREYAWQAASTNIDILQSAIDSGKLTVVEAEEDANKIKIIRAQLRAELQQIDAQGARTSAEAWQQADQEILSSEGQLIGDMVMKRQSLARDLEQVGWQLIEKELQQDAEYWTEAALLAVVGTGKIKATQQGGLVQRGIMSLLGGGDSGINPVTVTPSVLGQGGSVAATAAQTANTTALAANTTALTTLGALLGTNTAATAADTTTTTLNTGVTGVHAAATTAGAAATSANTAVQSTGLIAWIENTAATIENTIAEDWAAITALNPFASGSDSVPFDMPAYVHKGEMIIPADVAARVRAGNYNIGNLAELAGQNDLIPVDVGNTTLSTGSRNGGSITSNDFSRGGNTAVGGDTYNNMGGLHIHGMDLATIAHSPAFQREAMRVMRNMHRNAVRR